MNSDIAGIYRYIYYFDLSIYIYLKLKIENSIGNKWERFISFKEIEKN